ncbi:hypothetical protein WJX72_008265 [[Myrmecia] bisecta]|uniref:TFIIS N-terminal domain-containing protein n=1 Tax=[Myrmecia] bisecta TaxID=41462 RepID=A0AAW1R883_9CHLO
MDTEPAPDGTDTGQASTREADEQTVYVSFREDRKLAHKGQRKGAYSYRYFLVDAHGNETLAAYAEDQGDAHYLYKSVDGFSLGPPLACHNRRELLSWLEGVVQGTQQAAGFHLEQDDDAVLAETVKERGAAAPLPTYIAYRRENFMYEDGHRGIHWWLVDNNKHEHLAVTGEERETRDGHYTYRAEEPLNSIHPFESGNANGVYAYLDQLTTHPDSGSGGQASDHHAAGGHSSPGRSPIKRFVTGTRSPRKRVSSSVHSPKSKASPSKRAFELPRPPPHLSLDSPQSLFPQPHTSAANGDRVQQAQQAQHAQPAAPLTLGIGSAADPQFTARRVQLLTEAQDALRELASMHLSLRLVAATGLVKAVGELRQHPEPSIAQLASWLADQWQRIVARHLTVLTDPRYLQDPQTEAERVIQKGQAAITGTVIPPAVTWHALAASAPQAATAGALVWPPAALPAAYGGASGSQMAFGAAAAPVVRGDPGHGGTAGYTSGFGAVPANGSRTGPPMASPSWLAQGPGNLDVPGTAAASNPSKPPAAAANRTVERRRLDRELSTPAPAFGPAEAANRAAAAAAAAARLQLTTPAGSQRSASPSKAPSELPADAAPSEEPQPDAEAGDQPDDKQAESEAVPEPALDPSTVSGAKSQPESSSKAGSGSQTPSPSGPATASKAGKASAAGKSGKAARTARAPGDPEWDMPPETVVDEEEDDFTDTPLGRTIVFLRSQKERLSNCRFGHVVPIVSATVDGALARLNLHNWSRSRTPLRSIKELGASLMRDAQKLSRDKSTALNKRLKREVLQSLDNLLAKIEAIK